MNCPICNCSDVFRLKRQRVRFSCGSEFTLLGDLPRGERRRGRDCIAECGVCGDRLPHHVSHCAAVLKRKLPKA